MDPICTLVYGEQTHNLQRIPKTFYLLKNQIQSKFEPIKNMKVCIMTQEGSKILVTNNNQYRKALVVARPPIIVKITSVCETEESQIQGEDEIPIQNRRVFLRKSPLKLPAEKVPEEDIPEEERCSICYNRYQEPMISKCSHVLCHGCWVSTLSNYLECPMCRRRVRIAHLKPFNPSSQPPADIKLSEK